MSAVSESQILTLVNVDTAASLFYPFQYSQKTYQSTAAAVVPVGAQNFNYP